MRSFLLLVILVSFFFIYKNQTQVTLLNQPIKILQKTTIPVPTPKIYTPIETYHPPRVKAAGSYTILFVGDSMTAALGENFVELRPMLETLYPGKMFGLFNYGFAATNILSLEDRLHRESIYLGKKIPPILGRYYDVIIIESFGYNPLSQFSLEEGLALQNAKLDRYVAELYEAKPESLIVFLATIAPSKKNYALGVVDVDQEERTKQAEERTAYIQNHIAYAQKHNIPLINVYEKSLDKNGNAIMRYISPQDHIHPSPEGVRFISRQIADFFSENNLLPK